MRARNLSARQVATVVMGLCVAAFAVDALAVDEIIVTTRKREENLQKVPIAVQVVAAEEIARKGITSLGTLVQQSSSVILDQAFAPQDQRITIRGLAPTRGRQNVAVLQDGIEVGSESIATSGGSLLINPRLFDLERVEIVAGPQIALFGRSAFAGAINYITRKPGDEFEARAGTDIGSDGQLEVSGGIDGPLTDSLSAGIHGMTWSHDGFYTNSLTGENAGDADGTSIAGTVVWNITDKVSATARIENLDDEFGVTPYAVMRFNSAFDVPLEARSPYDPDGAGPIVGFAPLTTATTVQGVKGDTPDGDDLVLAMSEDPRSCSVTGNPECRNYPGSNRDITRATLTLDWDAGPVTLTSLTHLADADTFQFEGSEDQSANTPVDVPSPFGGTVPVSAPGEFWLDNETSLLSQEFRIASNGEGAITWVAGGLLWKEKLDVLDGSYTCFSTTGAPCGPIMAVITPGAPLDVPGDGLTPLNADKWTRDTDHYSVYGLVEWEFIDQWKLGFEGRQTWEDLEVLGPDLDNGLFFGTSAGGPFSPPPFAGPGTPASTGLTAVASSLGGKEDDSFFAPKVTLTWQATDDQLYYLSWAESFKPRGISALLAGTGAFYNTACGSPANPNCTDPIQDFRYDQEKLDNYELGAKTAWLDGRLRLNGALFFQDFKNKQVSTQVTDPNTNLISARIVNAGAAEVYGLEFDATWFASENLTLGLGYTYLHTEYTDYHVNTTGVGTISYVGNCMMDFSAQDLNNDGNFVDDPNAPTANDAGEVRRFCITDYSGNELEGAPEHALTGNARWQAGLVGSTDYFLESDFSFQDDRFASDKNQMIFPSHWLVNLRTGVVNETWDFIAYVDNALDDDTAKTGFEDGDIPTFGATFTFLNHGTLILPDPRTYGLRVNYRLGK